MFQVEWRGWEREGDDAMIRRKRRGRVAWIERHRVSGEKGEKKVRLEGSGFECFCCVCHSKSFKESALQFNVAEERCVYYCCEVIISGRWVGRWVGDSKAFI